MYIHILYNLFFSKRKNEQIMGCTWLVDRTVYCPKIVVTTCFPIISTFVSLAEAASSDWEKINNGVLGVVKKSIWKFHCHLLLLVMKVIEIDRLYWYVYKFECSINLVLKKFLHSLIIGKKTLVILGIVLIVVISITILSFSKWCLCLFELNKNVVPFFSALLIRPVL